MDDGVHKVMQALRYRKETGLCPICGKPAKRVTCGDIDCIRKWLGTPDIRKDIAGDQPNSSQNG